MLSLKIMNRVSIQIDSPSYVKVSEIGKELVAFSLTIERKHPQIDLSSSFCFRMRCTPHAASGQRSDSKKTAIV